ncbi:MAG: hypothetical protein ABL996_13410 [Micropepsaceae bacterium]
MTKRSQWPPKPTAISKDLENRLAGFYPPWPDGTDRVTGTWLEGIYDITRNGNNTAKLVRLLCSDLEFPRMARGYLADLLLGHKFARRPGRPRTLAFEPTHRDAVLTVAINDVSDLVNARTNRRTVAAALEEISEARGIPLNVLENAYKGKRASTNRIRKRRPT